MQRNARRLDMINSSTHMRCDHGSRSISAPITALTRLPPCRPPAICTGHRRCNNGVRPNGERQSLQCAPRRWSGAAPRAQRCHRHLAPHAFKGHASARAPAWSAACACTMCHMNSRLSSCMQGKPAPNYSDEALNAADKAVGSKRRRTFDTLIGKHSIGCHKDHAQCLRS